MRNVVEFEESAWGNLSRRASGRAERPVGTRLIVTTRSPGEDDRRSVLSLSRRTLRGRFVREENLHPCILFSAANVPRAGGGGEGGGGIAARAL